MPTALQAATSAEELTYSLDLLVAAAIVAVAGVLVAAVAILARRPPRIRAEGAGSALPSEPPAVASLLADDFVVPTEIAPAILLDLAARGVVDLEEVQPGKTICRLKPRAGDAGSTAALTDYEAQVLDEIRSKALDGVVPTEALTTGTEAVSNSWHRTLARRVVADSQARGLTHDRWPNGVAAFLGAPVIPIGILLYFGLDSGDHGADDVLAVVAGVVAVLGVVVLTVVAGRLGASLAQLPTAARVRGLAEHLRENEALADLPPASVKLYERHFAYAAAFGAAPLAVDLLPMGAEDDHRAWSRYGDRWRRVRVRYPVRWPPSWGRHPLAAVALALLWGAVGGLVIYGLVQILEADRDPQITQDAWDWVMTGTTIAVVPFVALIAWAAWVLVRAVPDLWQTVTVTGEIVRSRRFVASRSNNRTTYRYYLAVHDGTDDHVRAWRVRDDLWQMHPQGQTVTAQLTPRLRYVRSVEPASG